MIKLTSIVGNGSVIVQTMAVLDQGAADGIGKEIVARFVALQLIDGWDRPEDDEAIKAAAQIDAIPEGPISTDMVCKVLFSKGYLVPTDADNAIALLGIVKAVLAGDKMEVVIDAKSAKPMKSSKPAKESFIDNPTKYGSVIATANVNGVAVQVTTIDAASKSIRNAVAKLMQKVRPDVYAEYRKLKDGGDGSLEAKTAAYNVLFHAFIESTYRIPGL